MVLCKQKKNAWFCVLSLSLWYYEKYFYYPMNKKELLKLQKIWSVRAKSASKLDVNKIIYQDDPN